MIEWSLSNHMSYSRCSARKRLCQRHRGFTRRCHLCRGFLTFKCRLLACQLFLAIMGDSNLRLHSGTGSACDLVGGEARSSVGHTALRSTSAAALPSVVTASWLHALGHWVSEKFVDLDKILVDIINYFILVVRLLRRPKQLSIINYRWPWVFQFIALLIQTVLQAAKVAEVVHLATLKVH